MISYVKGDYKWVSVSTKCSSPVRIYVETFSNVIFSQKGPQKQTTVTFDLKAIESLLTFTGKKDAKKNADIILLRFFSTKSTLTKCQLTFNLHTKLNSENFQFIVSDSYERLEQPSDLSHQRIRFYMILLAGLLILIFSSSVIVGCLTSEGLSEDDNVVEMGEMTEVGNQLI
ncbi:hypothetical protein L5515_018645 [Caenorhabditis briggsae]|nr:hypothetical protein L3Y34_012795 [Caenorhabditis briggsae]UMM43026.1 hypothetical protein L5515_018645 [Caenorhabditis briggsae]